MLSENLDKTLRLYADLVRRPAMPKDQLEIGQQVILQEILAIEDDPAQKAMNELRRTIFGGVWGRPSHGEEETLLSLKSADVRSFHAKHYQPQGAVIGIAGKFHWEKFADLVEELFGDWQGASLKEPRQELQPPAYQFIEQASQQSHIGVAYPCAPYREDDYFLAFGASGVLGGGPSARLFTELREKRGLCYSVYSSTHTLRDIACIVCYVGTTADRSQESLDVLLEETRKLSNGVQPDELNRLKARLKSGLIMQQESSAARSGSIARDWVYLSRVRSLQELSSIVDSLDCSRVNDYLRRRPLAHPTIFVLGPNSLEYADDFS